MRSIRRTARPQLCAMSVALEAQGETVPSRGDDHDQRAVSGGRVGVAVLQQRGQLRRRRILGAWSAQTRCT
jgi:hypothetical protein